MQCTANLGGEIYKIIYDNGKNIIFTIKNVRWKREYGKDDVEYYNIIVRYPDLIKKVKENLGGQCTCIVVLKQKVKGTGSKKVYTYDFILDDITF